ncbi:hypothetical protein FACS1894159_06020 [Bacteroidia bacterium]|nr:hypothetical protein FACS1894159_06020 [Bacteroidia bacterium]
MRQFNLLLLTTLTVGRLTISGASGAPKNPKPKEQKRSELHATLTSKYGLTQQQAGNFDRRLKERYGMNPEQVVRYKELQNATAIERLKVRRSKLSPQEKKTRNEQITATHNQKLQAIISPDQTRKILIDKNYHEQRATKTATASPTPAAVKTTTSLPAKNSAPAGSTAPAKTPR